MGGGIGGLSEELDRSSSTFSVRAGSSRLDPGSRVLKSGETFVVLDSLGDIAPGGAGDLGLYHAGTRFLSRLALTLDGGRPFLLSSEVREAAPGTRGEHAVFVANLTNPDLGEEEAPLARGSVHLVRECWLTPGRLHAALHLRSYASRPARLQLHLAVGSDFADVFEVRGTVRPARGRDLPVRSVGGDLLLSYMGLDRAVRRSRIAMTPAPSRTTPDQLTFDLRLQPGEERILAWEIVCQTAEAGGPRGRPGRPPAPHRTRLRASREPFDAWLRRSESDLRMMTTRTAWGPYPYAGVPWFSAPFGRDGILTALELLWLDPEPARGVLRFLAAHQARSKDAFRDAEPGKILHEARSGEMAALGEVPFGRYYGSVDATPLFVVLAGAHFERTGDLQFASRLWPNVRRALDWMDRWGDVDGDGFIEYPGRSEKGLIHQGWKDSCDAIFHDDGSPAEGPIALCEVQGYAYAARRAAATLASALGRPEIARRLTEAADRLRLAFDEAFWLDDLQTYALALDGSKRPCRVRASNAGQALFSGIVPEEKAPRLARTLLESDSFSGWGVRTVADGQARYNPMSYHNGSVWPHDNALIAAGMGRYGLRAEAGRLLQSMFELSRSVDLARLPELICGFRRREGEGPTLYPLACAPQSWAAGAATMMLQATLGVRVDAANRRIVFERPHLPPVLESLSIEGLRVGTATVDLRLTRFGDGVSVDVARRLGHVEVEAIR